MKWRLIIIAIVKYNLLKILKLQHDILRPCYRPIIKVQNPNFRIFSPLSPCLPPLSMHLSLSSLCDKTIIDIYGRSVDIANSCKILFNVYFEIIQ